MKKTRIGLVTVSLLLICAMAVQLVGCSTEIHAENLMEDITPNSVEALDDLREQNPRISDFAIRLFRASEESGENTLISPLSVLCALAMTANGAEEETRAQMEEVFGMTVEELNLYLYSYIDSLPQDDEYKLSVANSIWLTDDQKLTVNKDFLQTNADYFGADIFKAPFNRQTCRDINNWVKENTDEMIPKILDQIPDEAIMYLVNALVFEAEWSEIYTDRQVREGEFTKEDGTRQDVEFMYSTESIYLEDEKATGFIKYYKMNRYAFVALLPNEGVSVSEYVASLDGKSLSTLLRNSQRGTVHTSMPKFETECNVEMAEILKGMGITDAFDVDRANFEGIGSIDDGNIYINRVLHKTFLTVDEQGTKAGAATVVELKGGGMPTEPKEVYLDRPFVYMLIDCENNIPFFIGTMMDVG